jgi:NAD-dependent dihydropyrimidine dehydrogenase PreA subunit
MIPPNIPREQIKWYPRIDLSKCTGDRACVEFCPHAVYRWDPAANQPVVAEPYNCVVACSRCVAVCKADAISFPTLEWLGEHLEQLRETQTAPGCG